MEEIKTVKTCIPENWYTEEEVGAFLEQFELMKSQKLNNVPEPPVE